jgi:hypothetical protein
MQVIPQATLSAYSFDLIQHNSGPTYLGSLHEKHDDIRKK